jgi:hypothetical protein
VVFSVRRIPGTLALALTNLVAAWTFVDDQSFRTSALFQVARDTAPLWVWCLAWAGSALGLLVAIGRRSMTLLHVAAGVSFATWAALVIGIGYVGATNPDVTISPIAKAMFFWVLIGQAAMILAPLWRPHGYYGDGRR